MQDLDSLGKTILDLEPRLIIIIITVDIKIKEMKITQPVTIVILISTFSCGFNDYKTGIPFRSLGIKVSKHSKMFIDEYSLKQIK